MITFPRFYPYALFFALLSVLCSCGNDITGDSIDYIDFGPSGMTPEKEYLFRPFDNLSDSDLGKESRFEIMLAVRYTDICKLQSLPLVVETSSTSVDSITTEKVSIVLYDAENKPTGKGHYGVYETISPLWSSMVPTENFTIAIKTTQPDSGGIMALGVICNQISH